MAKFQPFQVFLFSSVVMLTTALLAISGFLNNGFAQQSEVLPSIDVQYSQSSSFTLTVATIKSGSQYSILPVVASELKTLETFVGDEQPLLAINGGFFDPRNKKTVSHVKLGQQYWDPTQNERLTNNDGLKPYLPKVFNRTEFRTYECLNPQSSKSYRYAIGLHNGSDKHSAAKACTLVGVIGAGPQLLPAFKPESEAFFARNKAGKVIRDPLGIYRKNARSAVGLTKEGDVLLVMVGQNPQQPSGSGVTIPQLIKLLRENGAVEAMALDGGSSSALYIKSDLLSNTPVADKQPLLYGKWTTQKHPSPQPVVRALKSVLVVKQVLPPNTRPEIIKDCGFKPVDATPCQ